MYVWAYVSLSKLTWKDTLKYSTDSRILETNVFGPKKTRSLGMFTILGQSVRSQCKSVTETGGGV